MSLRRAAKVVTFSIGSAIGVTAVLYAAYVAVSWLTFGHHRRLTAVRESDSLLDRFMPQYDVMERHHVDIDAPADVTFAAAKELDLQQSAVVRAIFKARQVMMRGVEDRTVRPRGLVALTTSLGWGVLADSPNEIVLGAVTQPWKGDVVFRTLPPDNFAAFREPGYVKIVWNLRADAVGPFHSEAITETRVATTDSVARAKFRRYWACVSPGIIVIRWVSIGLVKDSAERLARQRAIAPSEE